MRIFNVKNPNSNFPVHRRLAGFGMAAENAYPIPFYAVTGSPGTGKSTLLAEIVRRATGMGIRCGGFLQPREGADHARCPEYLLSHVTDQSTLVLAHRAANSGFVFVEQAFEQARQWLKEDAVTAQLLVVDEFGRLEAEGGGHAPALEAALAGGPVLTLLAGVRNSALDDFRLRYSVARQRILDLDTERDKAELFTRSLMAALCPAAAPAIAHVPAFESSRNDWSEQI